MNDTRCIVVQPSKENPEGLIPVERCRSCSFYNEEGEYCEISNADWIEFAKSAKSIHKLCPLPFYERMRPHGPDEVPGMNTRQIVEMNDGDCFVLQYDPLCETWTRKLNGILHIFPLEDIKSWRYLEYL